MAKQTKLFLHKDHNTKCVTFTNADSTTAKQIFAAGADDSDLKLINITSDEAATVRNLQLFWRISGVNYTLATISIPALSGTNGTVPSRNALNNSDIPGLLIDPVGKLYLNVKAGHEIWAGMLVAVTAAKTITVTCSGHDY